MWVHACGFVRACAGMLVHSCVTMFANASSLFSSLILSLFLSLSLSLLGGRALSISLSLALFLSFARTCVNPLCFSLLLSLSRMLSRTSIFSRACARTSSLFHSLSLSHTSFPLSAFHWLSL